MSTDLPQGSGGEREAEPAATPPAADAPALSELQEAIRARARETIARRESKPPRSRTQLLVVLAVTLGLAVIAFAGLNYIVGTAQRLIAEYAASKKEEPKAPPAPPTEDSGVIILQPDRTLTDPNAPAATPPPEPKR